MSKAPCPKGLQGLQGANAPGSGNRLPGPIQRNPAPTVPAAGAFVHLSPGKFAVLQKLCI